MLEIKALTSKRDFDTDIDENEDRQQMHLPQSENLSVFAIFLVSNRCVGLCLTNLGKTLCNDVCE